MRRACTLQPLEEADIQCYLYYLCLRKLRDPTKIHAEAPREGEYIDLVLGTDRLPVEIKWSYIRGRKKVSKGWAGDIEKPTRQSGNRKPTFALFLSSDDGSPVQQEDLTAKEKKPLQELIRLAGENEVRLLLPYNI